MTSYITWTRIFKFLYKYLPHDDLLRKKLVAKIWNNYIKNIFVSDGVGIFFHFNRLQPTGHVMHHQFNIQQLYALPTLYLCVLYLSENKQRLVPLTA